jgi:hypothetical protein
MICSSVNRLGFMSIPFQVMDSTHFWRSYRGSAQMAFAVDITGVDDRQLEFAGYYLIDENEEFKVYRNKMQDYIVRKANNLLYVDELDEAQTISRGRIINLGHDDD